MRRSSLFLAAIAVLIGGCGVIKPASSVFAGKWQLDPKSIKSSDPKEDESAAKEIGEMIFDFRENKTFTLSTRQGDKNGTFEVENGTVTMHLANPKSDSEKQAIVGKLKDEGKTLEVTGGGTKFTMKFRKL
ncbi:MAG TPA: hypothetical protein VKT78_05065 [Fimbriimonadaceae bacterium]|nr:hypothetical protein [Fimbriimonadaceae bacterium]